MVDICGYTFLNLYLSKNNKLDHLCGSARELQGSCGVLLFECSSTTIVMSEAR